MSSPSTTSQQNEAAAEADVVAFLQFLLFLGGTSLGSFASGWTLPIQIVLGLGLGFPAARTWLERRVRRNVVVDAGTPAFRTRAQLTAVVFLAGALYSYCRPSELCATLVCAPFLGFAADNFLSASTLGFNQLRQWRSVRGWTCVEVVSVHDGIATIQRGADVVLARADGELPLGSVYVDMDLRAADYRLGAAPRIHDYESHQARRRRHSLGQLAAIKLCSGLMWVGVVLSPLLGETFGERH